MLVVSGLDKDADGLARKTILLGYGAPAVTMDLLGKTIFPFSVYSPP